MVWSLVGVNGHNVMYPWETPEWFTGGNGKEYARLQRKRVGSLRECAKMCAAHGGSLPCIENAEDHSEVGKILRRGGNGKEAWMGLYLSDDTCNWVHVSKGCTSDFFPEGRMTGLNQDGQAVCSVQTTKKVSVRTSCNRKRKTGCVCERGLEVSHAYTAWDFRRRGSLFYKFETDELHGRLGGPLRWRREDHRLYTEPLLMSVVCILCLLAFLRAALVPGPIYVASASIPASARCRPRARVRASDASSRGSLGSASDLRAPRVG